MSNIEAKIIADSQSLEGIRLTTFLLRYPRFIHAELMTHRVFSRNASSSRAIPNKKLIADIRANPATFEFWGKNQTGMQANESLVGIAKSGVQWLWIIGMWIMTILAQAAALLGAHKQTVNRMIEPWSHITVVVTATDFGNWFALRHHPDAQPEIRVLAEAMLKLYESNPVNLLLPGEWHLPFVDDEAKYQVIEYVTLNNLPISMCDTFERQVSVARCARTSYKTHDNRVATVKEEIDLYARLIERTPLHASPTEHQATPDTQHQVFVTKITVEAGTPGRYETRWDHPEEHGNLFGWRQFRKMLPGENQPTPAHAYGHLIKARDVDEVTSGGPIPAHFIGED